MQNHKRLLIIIGLLSLVLLGTVLLLVIAQKRPQAPSPALSEPSLPTTQKPEFPTTPTHFMDVEAVVAKTGTTATIQLWLNPQSDPINISTLNLHASLTSSGEYIIPTSSTVQIDEELKAQGWTFPFATATAQGDQAVEIKIAAMFVSTQPYALNQKVLLGTIPVRLDSAAAELTLTFPQENNKAYTNTNELVAINQTGQAIKL